jgi:hypothetical protein
VVGVAVAVVVINIFYDFGARAAWKALQ